MLVYQIKHTEDGTPYTAVIQATEKDTVEHIENLLPYSVAGDTITVSTLEMTQEEFDALPEFEGH